MNRDLDFKIQRKEELLKRRKKLIKLLITLILFLIVVMYIIKIRTENSYIKQIGLNLIEIYSNDNYKYSKTNINDEKNYLIIKRLNNHVYYEKQEKVNSEYVKSIYYFDLNTSNSWKILEDEKIILTDEYIEYKPNIINGSFVNGNSALAENYAIMKCMLLKPSDNILAFKSAGNVFYNGEWKYKIKLNTVSGKEVTYFDKETFKPIESIIETEKNGNIEFRIDVEENTVSKEDFKIVDDFTKMKIQDYSEYKRVMGL